MTESTTPQVPARPRSVWQATSPSIPVDEAVPARADIVVVGAGLAGLATAAMLARAGRSVAVLEAREVGAVATGNTTAKLSLLQGSVFSGIRSHAGEQALEAYVAANHAGQDWVRAELVGDPDALEQRPAVTYATTPQGVRGLEQEAEALAAVGLDVDVLEQGQDVGLPYPVARALRMRDQWQIHPLRLLAKLAADIRDRGGVVVTGCRVLGADVEDDGVVVKTSRGSILGDRVVVTSGSPVIDRAAFFARLKPSRSLVGAYRVPGEIPHGMYVSLDPEARSLRTARDAHGRELLVVGGSGFEVGRERDTDRLLGEIDQWTRAKFPGAERVTWWAAQDYRTLSRVPFAGAMPGSHERIHVATGFNKWGMTNAAAAALTICGDLLGQPVPWADALRAPHLNVRDGADFVTTNAGVAASAVQGIVRAVVGSGTIDEGDGHVVRDGLHPVAEAQVDGRVCRVSAICTHMHGILEWNRAEQSWDCPLHGSRFAPDGEVLEGPAVRDLKPAE
ncbi:FAD-dependent oxidoreductase [Microbacterium sp. NPDC096154]|uniref:FAD-dependent oxidoreductase n=1 Tax=Microbacterium sp. NPDC096154 TaxID=3155549 RepID=UPI00331D151B